MLIGTYVQRIMEWAPVSPECFIAAFVYVNRIVQKAEIELDECSVHRLVLVAVLIAAKFLEDVSVTNTYYASIGGISLQELNQLELTFLQIIEFDLSVDDLTWRTYQDYLQQYQNKLQRKRQKAERSTKKSRTQDLSDSAEYRLELAERRYTMAAVAAVPGNPRKVLAPPLLSVSAPLPPALAHSGPTVNSITTGVNRLWVSAPLPPTAPLSVGTEQQDKAVREFWKNQLAVSGGRPYDPMEF